MFGGLDCQGSESCVSEGMGIVMEEDGSRSSNMCYVCVRQSSWGELQTCAMVFLEKYLPVPSFCFLEKQGGHYGMDYYLSSLYLPRSLIQVKF